MNTRLWLQLEGAVALAACVSAYILQGGSWLLFAALFFAPDMFMLGYLRNARLGSVIYNLVHNYALPVAVTSFTAYRHDETLTLIGLIWLAHISFDRMLGYGLKFPTEFKDTHLSAG